MAIQARPAGEVYYPEDDGVPVGETGTHYDSIGDFVHQLRARYRHRRHDVHVSANQFWYYEEGDPTKVICPDVYVVFGVPAHPPRRVWKTWEDHCFPSVAVEFTSRSTQRRDTGPKKDLYERLGADELWLFDPFGEYLHPRLQGWRREAGRFVRIRPDAAGRLDSSALNASLREDGMRIVVVERDGTEIPPLPEVWGLMEAARRLSASEAHRADQAAQRAEQEAQRAEQEAQRAEQEAQRAEQEAQRAEQEAQRAEQEAQRADLEAQRADLAAQRADQEARRADQQAQRADREARRAARMAERLRALGVEDDEP